MKKRKGLLPAWLVPLAFLALCGYLFFLLIQYQVSIASKQQELQSLQNQLTVQETTNAELSSTLDQGDSAIIERYAREQGDKSVWYIDGEGIFRGPEEDACTTDGSHPNDLGFMKMADSIGRILRRAMRRNI